MSRVGGGFYVKWPVCLLLSTCYGPKQELSQIYGGAESSSCMESYICRSITQSLWCLKIVAVFYISSHPASNIFFILKPGLGLSFMRIQYFFTVPLTGLFNLNFFQHLKQPSAECSHATIMPITTKDSLTWTQRVKKNVSVWRRFPIFAYTVQCTLV